MSDSNWEALAEIYLRYGETELNDREYIQCLCSRVLVKNQTEAVAIEQEELSEAYDIFNEQYCENHVGTMNRLPKEHSQEEEDSDANSCYYSASASHTDNYCTTDEHERDSGADISEYHGMATSSRERFRRSHRDENGKSSSTSMERTEEKDLNEQWEKYWSEHCERLIWTSWIEKYSDFINPEYQNLTTDETKDTNQTDDDTLVVDTAANTEIVVSTCSPAATVTAPTTTAEVVADETNNSDLREMMDSLALPRCDSVSSSIPLTIGTTDSMTNVTQMTLSSYGFCSSHISSSENSHVSSESTPSSMSAPFGFDEDDETKIEMMNEEDSSDQQWQLLWQQHYQEQYNKHYNEFLVERKPAKALGRNILTDGKTICVTEPQNTDDDELEMDELKHLSELGLPTSFGKYNRTPHFKSPANPRQIEEPNADRVKAAFTLMGFSFQNNNNLMDTGSNGHVVYRKRNIRLHNNMLKMKKKRIDFDNSVRDEALLNLIADSSSDEADKPLPNIGLVKFDSSEAPQPKEDIEPPKVDVEPPRKEVQQPKEAPEKPSIVHAEVPTSFENVQKPIALVQKSDKLVQKSDELVQKSDEVVQKTVEVMQSGKVPAETKTENSIEDGAVIAKANSKKSKKKRRQNKMLAGLPAEIANDRTLYKYWCKRFSLFSLFDLGIKLDRESWFSVTPEKVATYTAMRCQCDVIIDAFCGAGGNTIQFAKTCQRVIAIDIDEKKIEMAKHNASIYGVADRIEFIVGDYFKLATALKADVVFLSPPWGGPQYLKEDVYDIEKSLLPLPATELMEITRKISSNIAIYLPRNTNTHQLAMLAGRGNTVEIEQGFLDRKLIAITAFYGNLLKNVSN